jgi:hypothetical protein
MMVGAFDFARYEEAPLTLAKGDLLLVFPTASAKRRMQPEKNTAKTGSPNSPSRTAICQPTKCAARSLKKSTNGLATRSAATIKR